MLYALNDPLASFVFIYCIIVWKCMLKCVLRVRIDIYIYILINQSTLNFDMQFHSSYCKGSELSHSLFHILIQGMKLSTATTASAVDALHLAEVP